MRANRHGEDVEKREGRGLRRSAGEIEQLRCGFPQPELSSFCTARLSLFCMAGLFMILHGGDIHDDEWAGYYVWVSRDFSYENVIVILRDGAAHGFACRGDP